MHISLLRAKVHRAEITDANLFYEGSLTLDEDLMDAAGLMEYEKIHVVNVNNGARFNHQTITLTADIVAAHVSNNSVAISD